MCYCCNKREAISHCVTELSESIPGEIMLCIWFFGIVYCLDYIFWGRYSAHSHIIVYVYIAIALIIVTSIAVLCIRLHDIKFTKSYAKLNDNKCYNCGRKIL